MPVAVLTGSPLRKAEEVKKLVPPWMAVQHGSIIGAILRAIGTSDQHVTVGERTLFVRGADAIGSVRYTAVVEDDGIRVNHLASVNPSALSVVVSGKDILVTLETDAVGNILTSASALAAAVGASVPASGLVVVTTFGTASGAVSGFKGYLPVEPDGLEGARRAVLLDYARGGDLLALAHNYGVEKPYLLGLTDDRFRAYVAVLALQKKVSRGRVEALLTVIFGPKGTAGWSVYESLRRRTITIEVTASSLAVGPATGVFPRALTTVSPPTSTPKNSTIYNTGDYLRESAVSTYVPKVAVRPGGIASTPLSAVSAVANNSVYARGRGANRPALLAVMRLVRAAGVQVEFIQRRD